MKSPLGQITKKKRLANYCKNVTGELDGTLEKYHETLACTLGNSFIYGGEAERKKVTDTMSEIVDLVMDTKGSKNGLAELLLPDTYQNLLDSLRVPDWVLLYFKLQARLPDAAWQTMLNLTQLGRSGVGTFSNAYVLISDHPRGVKPGEPLGIFTSFGKDMFSGSFYFQDGGDVTNSLKVTVYLQRCLAF